MLRISHIKVITALMVSVLIQQASYAEIDTEFITPDSSAAVVLYPQKTLASDHLKMFPIEVLSAMSKKEFGFDPVNLDSILLVAAPPAESGIPRVGLIASFNERTRIEDLLPMLIGDKMTKSVRFSPNGPMYRQGQDPFAPSLYQLDDKTVIVANEEMLKAMLAQKKKPKTGPLAQLVNKSLDESELQVFVAVEPVRDLAGFMIAPMKFPTPFEPVKNLPSQVDSISVKVSISDSIFFETKLTATDEESAQEVQATVNQLLAFYQKMAEALFDKKHDDVAIKAVAEYQVRMSKMIAESLTPTREGNVLTLSTKGNEQLTPQILIGYTMALVMPAIAQSRMTAQRMSSMNNLKQIGLSLHNYHDTYSHMPSQTIKSKDGKSLLSWRVHILPFIEHAGLYNQFHLDEPWNSEHNIKLIDQLPQNLRRPGSTAQPGLSNYLVPLAKGLPFQEVKELKFRDITDGTSNTIAVLEVPDENAVIWTKPDDWQIDLTNPLKGLESKNRIGFLALFFDGSVHAMSTETMTKEKFIKLLTHAGGELVDF